MSLTDTSIHNAKPASKPYKITDGGGMYIEVMPMGSKYWRLKYRFGGKEKRRALGIYPDVSLSLARERREEARKLLADGIDPGEVRKKERALIQKAALSMRLVILPDGMCEVWQGRKLIARLTASQAHELRDLLNNTTGG
jgi:hypothetical protein